LPRQSTDAHVEATGAQRVFVHVFFNELPSGVAYTAGELDNKITGINGAIRDGRTLEVKQQLIKRICASWSEITGQFGASFIFVSMFRLVLADVPVNLAGTGSGLMITLQQSSYALGVATLGTLFLAIGDRDGFAWVVGIQAAIAVAVGIESLALPALSAPSRENLELESLPLEL
jgi:phenylpyruvate tautomerase PptA (4-oxalocrotonate tautomerase family)